MNGKILSLLLFSLIIQLISAGLFSQDPELESTEEYLVDASCKQLATNQLEREETVVDSLNETVELELKTIFRSKVDCFASIFDNSLLEIADRYSQPVDETSTTTESAPVNNNGSNNNNKKDKKKNKNKKLVNLPANHGQIGLIFYSIDQNNNISIFKHENFQFLKSAASNSHNADLKNLNETTVEELEHQVANYANDLNIFKTLLSSIKEQVKEKERRVKNSRAALSQEEVLNEEENQDASVEANADELNQEAEESSQPLKESVQNKKPANDKLKNKNANEQANKKSKKSSGPKDAPAAEETGKKSKKSSNKSGQKQSAAPGTEESTSNSQDQQEQTETAAGESNKKSKKSSNKSNQKESGNNKSKKQKESAPAAEESSKSKKSSNKQGQKEKAAPSNNKK